MTSSNMEQLEIFLGGTFHQDINDPDEALQQYIDDVDSEWLGKLALIISSFLDSELSDNYKNDFISDNAEIYFQALGMSPMEWLRNVLNTIKMNL